MNRFAQVPIADIQRASFGRDHTTKLTMDAGYLVPCFIDEVLPGDTFNLDMSVFARMATPVVPIMDDLYFDTFFFFVPNRLVWDDWEYFMGATKNGVQYKKSDYAMPCITCPENGFATESIADYFGLPTNVGGLKKITALPFRAYNLIFKEWFMDANLYQAEDVPTVKTDSTDDDYSLYPLLRRGKRHDYFTSSLPWPCKGDSVSIPLGGVVGNGMALGITDGTNTDGLRFLTTEMQRLSVSSNSAGADIGASVTATSPYSIGVNKAVGVSTDPSLSGLITESTSINSLRQAFMLQKFLETSARSGSNRYTEILRAHFSVISPDARLQRPEYLGGGSGMITIATVPQTSATDQSSVTYGPADAQGNREELSVSTTSGTPQGNLSAYGLYSDPGTNGFSKSFVEHGFVIGFINVRANLTYQQGIERFWTRDDRYDYYWPEFAHLGEQEVLNKEIFAQGTEEDDEVFGYQERYAEYRYKPSKVCGKFKSSDPQSLDVWHLSQYFDTLPRLSVDFIQDDPPLDRVLAIPSEPAFKVDLGFKLNCVRPMPVYGIPGFTGHF